MASNRASRRGRREAEKRRQNDESPALAGTFIHGRGWFRTSDLSRVKRDVGDGEEPPEQGRLC